MLTHPSTAILGIIFIVIGSVKIEKHCDNHKELKYRIFAFVCLAIGAYLHTMTDGICGVISMNITLLLITIVCLVKL